MRWQSLVNLRRRSLARAVEAEQWRLARELHDNVAQDLAFIIGQSRALSLALPGQRGPADIEAAAASALEETRSMIGGLGGTASHTLSGEVERCGRALAGRAGLDLAIDLSDDVTASAEVQHGLLSILREAVSNAARHAHPTRLAIALRSDQGIIQLRISDDGCGFDPDLVERAGDHGLGLLSLHERARELGGQLSVTSTTGHGTTIDVAVPTGTGGHTIDRPSAKAGAHSLRHRLFLARAQETEAADNQLS